jgi:hypothetical protein
MIRVPSHLPDLAPEEYGRSNLAEEIGFESVMLNGHRYTGNLKEITDP